MININLVIKPEPRLRWQQLAAAVGVAVVLAGGVGFGLNWWAQVRQVTAEQAAVAELADAYRAAAARGGSMQAAEATAQQAAAWLAEVGRNQAPYSQSRVLAALFQAAGADVALTDITFLAGRELTVMGRAPSFAAATRYLERMRALPALAWVQERRVETGPAGETRFTFQAGVKAE